MTTRWKNIPDLGARLVLLLLPMLAMAAADSEAQFRDKFFLEPSVILKFVDEKDAPIDMVEFSRQTSAGKTFSIIKRKNSINDPVTIATFKLMAPPSAEEVAKARDAEAQEKLIAQKSKWIGKPLPSFKLLDVEGKPFSNADLVGRPTLINFFFAECLPCILETPMLNEYQAQRKDLRMLAVTFDDKLAIEKYIRKHKFAWQSLVNAQPFLNQIGVQAYPSFMLVDEKGIVRAVQASPDFVLIEEKGVIRAIPISRDNGKEGVGKVASAQDLQRLDDWVKLGLGKR